MQYNVTEQKLKNDITTLFIDVPGLKSLDVAIAINSGYRFATKDNIDKYEIPHILEHLVFDGSKRYPTNDDLQSIFSLGGGESNGFTTPYHNVFTFHNRVRNAEAVITASLDMVFFPRLDEKSFTEEYSVVENEIKESMGDFSGNAMAYVLQQVLPDFPSSADTQLARLPNVSFKDVSDYHSRYYVTANATVMVAADFQKLKKIDVENLILNATEKVPKGVRRTIPKFDVVKANPKSVASVPTHKSMTDSVAHISFMVEGQASIKDMLPLGLFGAIATSMKSYSVNYKLRKQGLVYGVDFSGSQSVEAYGLDLAIAADSQKFHAIYAYILEAIRDLASKGISQEQFEAARRDFAESFENSVESADAVIGWYLQDYLMDGVLHSPAYYASAVRSITQQQMLESVQRVFKYENLYYAVFSAKAIRVSSSMELLAGEVIRDNKHVTQDMLDANSYGMGGEDRVYVRAMYAILSATLVVFIFPLGLDADGRSLSDVYIAGLSPPLNLIAAVYFGFLFILPLVMRGRELRALNARLAFVFLAWMLILAVFDFGSFTEPFRSTDVVIRTHAWLLLGLLVVLLVATLVAVRASKNASATEDSTTGAT